MKHLRKPSPEKAAEIERLYKAGMGCKAIARDVRASVKTVHDHAKSSGIEDQSRKGRAWNKGKIAVSTASQTYLVELRKEIAYCKRHDEANHWRNHPEVLRWATNKRARINSAKYRKLKTNYHISKNLRSRVYSVLKGLKKSAPTFQLIGCNINQLKRHLASMFTKRMSWENYGKVWEIDHIIPCCNFDLSLEDEQLRAFHFSNLQPLYVSKNRRKPKREPSYQQNFRLGILFNANFSAGYPTSRGKAMTT